MSRLEISLFVNFGLLTVSKDQINLEASFVSTLFTEYLKPLSLPNVDIQIMFDSDGNFTGVRQGGPTYSVEDWNKHVQDGF